METMTDEMWGWFSQQGARVVHFAFEEAAKRRHSHVCSEHLLAGLIREENCVAGRILVQELGIPLARIRRELEPLLFTGNQQTAEYLSPHVLETILQAHEDAQATGSNYIGTEHVLLAFVGRTARAAQILQSFGATRESVRKAIEEMSLPAENTPS